MRRSGLVLALGLLAVASCGGDDDGVPDEADGGIDAVVVDGGGGDGAPGDGPGSDGAAAVCGDRAIDRGEECDDGNTVDGDGCDATCHREVSPSCGDAIVDYALGEECDDGNTTAGDGCDATCRREAPAGCGDGVLDLDAGEQCDDGNTTAGDGCSPTCQFETVGGFCGDGLLDPGEVCDDTNTLNSDGCNPTCNFTNETTAFVGRAGNPGLTDDVGTDAQIGGIGTLAADATSLWLADSLNRVVRQIDVGSADVVTVAGDVSGGPAAYQDDPTNGLNARFVGVEAITTDGNTVWVADTGRLRAIDAAPPHGVITVAGQGPSTSYAPGNGTAASFDDLRGLTYHDGLVYFVDANAGVLGSFDPLTGDVVTLAGTAYSTDCPPGSTPVDGVGAAASFCSPRYMASDNSGMLYVADTNGNTMRAYNTVTAEVTTFAGTGSCGYVDGTGTAAAIHRPRGMTSDGTSLYWVEFNAHTIRQGVLATAEVSTMIGTPAPCTLTCSCGAPPPGGYLEGTGAAAQLANPFSIAYHFPSRSLFFVDGANALIRRVR